MKTYTLKVEIPTTFEELKADIAQSPKKIRAAFYELGYQIFDHLPPQAQRLINRAQVYFGENHPPTQIYEGGSMPLPLPRTPAQARRDFLARAAANGQPAGQ